MIRKSLIIIIVLIFLVGCIFQSNSNDENTTYMNSENEVNNQEEGEEMKIILDDKEYTVRLQNNRTVDDIVSMLPLELELQQYANHEYYVSLPETPYNDAQYGTSYIKTNGLYYWDGWNAFVINYEDSDIAPYTPIYLGDIEGDIASVLKTKGEKIQIIVE